MIRIYYSNGSYVEFSGKEGWGHAPDTGVQVIVRWPMQDGIRWTCNRKVVRDRDLWTGEDSYDPFGWGVKLGELIATDDYFRIWERACGDSYP